MMRNNQLNSDLTSHLVLHSRISNVSNICLRQKAVTTLPST